METLSLGINVYRNVNSTKFMIWACITKIGLHKYCDMTPESRNSKVRIDVHY
jgi:hypothetical protein